MDISLKYLPLIVVLIVLLIVISKHKKKKFSRHDHNWKKAADLHRKLNEFNGDGVGGRVISYLRQIDPFVFEELLLYSFQQKGCKVIRNKRYTGDGGVDGRIITPAGKKILIQAKRYKNHVNLQDVKTFNQMVKTDSWATHGYFIHTGRTGKGSKQAPDTNTMIIVSGEKLVKLITAQKNQK